VATTKLGAAAALELAQVLADMEACDSAAEFCDLYPSVVSVISSIEKCVKLATGYSVRFRSGHPSYPAPPAEVTDWNKVTRLRIVSIEAGNG